MHLMYLNHVRLAWPLRTVQVHANADVLLVQRCLFMHLVMCGLMVVVTGVGVSFQTLQERPGVLEQTLLQFLCQYFGEEQPSNDLLKRIELEE